LVTGVSRSIESIFRCLRESFVDVAGLMVGVVRGRLSGESCRVCMEKVVGCGLRKAENGDIWVFCDVDTHTR
jgi:hypothetical protein